MTQGDPVSPNIFNMVLDAEARATMMEVYILQETQHGMGWSAWDQEIIFYSDDGRIAWRNPIWFQGMLTKLVRMFERMYIDTNMGKTKSMKCMPGFIWAKIGKYAQKRRATGYGSTYQEWKWTRVS